MDLLALCASLSCNKLFKSTFLSLGSPWIIYNLHSLCLSTFHEALYNYDPPPPPIQDHHSSNNTWLIEHAAHPFNPQSLCLALEPFMCFTGLIVVFQILHVLKLSLCDQGITLGAGIVGLRFASL